MADRTVSGDSAEAVAYQLYSEVYTTAQAEAGGAALTLEQRLNLFAKCLQTVKGQRIPK